MKLPKYEMFSIVGIINLLIGTYLCQWLLSIGISDIYVFLLLLLYYTTIIYLYDNLRIELEVSVKQSKNKNEE